MHIVIVGAGAAGCFFAIESASALAGAKVTVFDAGPYPLAKVSVTGGGKCNLTNTFRSVDDLFAVYPRGARLMKRALCRFNSSDLMEWFEKKGVRLYEREEGRIFPQSLDAMEIVRTLEKAMSSHGVEVVCGSRVTKIALSPDSGYDIYINDSAVPGCHADALLVSTGGMNGRALPAFEGIDLEIEKPVPSLFGFRLDEKLAGTLAGVSVPEVTLKTEGDSVHSSGGLVFTHKGISGPAVLRLSSYAARKFSEAGWDFKISVNWMGNMNQDATFECLESIVREHPRMQLSSFRPGDLPGRLWEFLLGRTALDPVSRWCEIGKKGLNRLVNVLNNDIYHICGRETNKEEFVTCGGVALSNISLNTMEAKKYPGLYFAGEVLDVDAVTGGYNLQAAWSMGYVAAHSIINNFLSINCKNAC